MFFAKRVFDYTAHPRSISTISSREQNNILMLTFVFVKTFRSKQKVL